MTTLLNRALIPNMLDQQTDLSTPIIAIADYLPQYRRMHRVTVADDAKI
ncbi:MAG: hypothetical protein HON77_06260 [Gammaproteobacteria bacterium]|nr:hypothetical protein [Gammaproteobacteria bacterium]MBT5685027.1 hypothetical protein [Gammaproteobacteria bacterium]MBT6583892.1 hypothetical protein [Gammaproteobacteria bacterium]